MSVTDYSKFRLGALTLADLDALAASAGTRTQAVREAAAYWRQAVEAAGRQNAAELSAGDWERLARLNRPEPPGYDDEARSVAMDWSRRLAHELAGMWEGRAILPLHEPEAKACRALARRVAGWGPVRGYALFAALRWFWRTEDAPRRWWQVELWMGVSRGEGAGDGGGT